MKLKQFFCRHKEIVVLPVDADFRSSVLSLSVTPVCNICLKKFEKNYIWFDEENDLAHATIEG